MEKEGRNIKERSLGVRIQIVRVAHELIYFSQMEILYPLSNNNIQSREVIFTVSSWKMDKK